jgi:hypothetical protein
LLAHIPDATRNNKLVRVPLPRYFIAACCTDPELAANRGEENFGSGTLGGLESLSQSRHGTTEEAAEATEGGEVPWYRDDTSLYVMSPHV